MGKLYLRNLLCFTSSILSLIWRSFSPLFLPSVDNTIDIGLFSFYQFVVTFWKCWVLHFLTWRFLLNIGYLHSTFEGYCTRKNEWLEEASRLSAWEKDGNKIWSINIICTSTRVFSSGFCMSCINMRFLLQVEYSGCICMWNECVLCCIA